MGSIGYTCRTIEGSARYNYVFDDCSSAEGGIYLRQGQANNPCRTVLALRGVSVFDQAILLLPCWTNNHCSRPGLNVVIKHYWPSFPPPLYTRHFLSSVCNFQ